MFPKSAANSVVREIGKLVNKNINMMNVNGIIIASTDHSRIGQSHWGAKQIIEKNLDELYITREDILAIDTKNYVQRGLNLSLVLDNRTIGVIGITGEYKEVVQIGRIVKKMAEILIEEQVEKQKSANLMKSFEVFLHEFLNYRTSFFSKSFVEQAESFKFTLKENYIIIVMHNSSKQKIKKRSKQDEVTRITKNKADSLLNKSYVLDKNNQWIVLIPNNFKINTSLESSIQVFCKKLVYELKKTIGYNFSFGISSYLNSNVEPYNILQQANQALFIADINHLTKKEYDNIGLENILFYWPETLKNNYLNIFFKDMKQDAINQYVKLFEMYFRYEGSITKIAKEMFVHSNTVQYRLNKFAKLAGKDIRKISQSHFFYLAMILEKERRYLNENQ